MTTLAPSSRPTWRTLLQAAAVLALVALAFVNLENWPATWFDEGSHLHVPKTLVRFGVYADYSSEGFRYYGPVNGVGPTVMLPVAAAVWAGGMSLGVARAAMAVYLLAAALAAYLLARQLLGPRLAWVAAAILVVSRAVGFLEFGREALGEVPGLFFMLAGLWVWFAAWERASWGRLILAGSLLGLATVTKQQYLLVLAPTLLAAWGLNLVYHRSAPQRVFLVPGVLTALWFAAWQAYLMAFLGPGTFAENLAQYREFTAGAALVFSPALMVRGLQELLQPRVFLWALFPALVYGVRLVGRRDRAGHQWAILWVLVAWNLVWYVFASVSWLRYAFPALAVSSLFITRFFADLTGQLDWRGLWVDWHAGTAGRLGGLARAGLLAWLAALVVIPAAQNARDVFWPPVNQARALADYLNVNVPLDDVVETWEPEMGFLTDHRYHYPPQILLNTAVKYVWQSGPPPAAEYTFVQDEQPPYILVGAFGRWVDLYASALQSGEYELQAEFGAYQLYRRRP